MPAKTLYGPAWRKARAAFLRKHPLCKHCEAHGRVTAASVVDHLVPHRGDPVIFWDSARWVPLCKRHHDQKTASQDGGFGNPVGVKGCDVNGLPLDPRHDWNRKS